MKDQSYTLMISPVSTSKSFDDFTKEEAKQYFDWYVAQSDVRIKQLQRYIVETGMSGIVLDGTIESLIPLWKWFEGNIRTEKKNEEEIEAALVGQPEWVHPYIRAIDWKLTVLTQALAVDISIYFAKVFIDQNPGIKWGYYTKPKNREYVNRPVLLGFVNNIVMDPRLIVFNCCLDSVEEKKETRLSNIFNAWVKNIPKEV